VRRPSLASLALLAVAACGRVDVESPPASPPAGAVPPAVGPGLGETVEALTGVLAELEALVAGLGEANREALAEAERTTAAVEALRALLEKPGTPSDADAAEVRRLEGAVSASAARQRAVRARVDDLSTRIERARERAAFLRAGRTGR
jgi:hypothetical protein